MIGTNKVLIILRCVHLNDVCNCYFHVGFWNYTDRGNSTQTDLVKRSNLRGKRPVNNRLSHGTAEYSRCTGLFQWPYSLSVSLRSLYTLERRDRIIIRNRAMWGARGTTFVIKFCCDNITNFCKKKLVFKISAKILIQRS